MNRGPKLKSSTTKKLAGTYRKSVDGTTAPIVQLKPDIPIAPAWLSPDAKAVWSADLDRVVKCGATEVDSSFFALYCDTMATFLANPNVGTAAFRSELRKQMEMLGITAAKSRLARGPAKEAPSDTPFKVRPH